MLKNPYSPPARQNLPAGQSEDTHLTHVMHTVTHICNTSATHLQHSANCEWLTANVLTRKSEENVLYQSTDV